VVVRLERHHSKTISAVMTAPAPARTLATKQRPRYADDGGVHRLTTAMPPRSDQARRRRARPIRSAPSVLITTSRHPAAHSEHSRRRSEIEKA